MQGAFPGFAAWDRIAEWRGVESILFDSVDRPEFLHQLMRRVTDLNLMLLDQLESQGLLGFGQPTVHCSGAYTDELPAAEFEPTHPRARDLWTSGMAQIFATVSPSMHQEFELDYAVEWYSRFGLVYYGCCEPLHNKIGIVSQIPNLRKISISPWADVAKSAQQIGSRFVMSRKPNPAFLAGPTWDADFVKADLQTTMEQCAQFNCPLEFILKDVSTVCYEPQRLWQWVDTAMNVFNS